MAVTQNYERSPYWQLVPLTTRDPSLDVLLSLKGGFNGNLEKYLIPFAFDLLLLNYESSLWCSQNHEKINAAIEQIKQGRLLMLMQSDGVRRANDDLSRALVRTLNEFRRYNLRRMKDSVFDADQVSEE